MIYCLLDEPIQERNISHEFVKFDKRKVQRISEWSTINCAYQDFLI